VSFVTSIDEIPMHRGGRQVVDTCFFGGLGCYASIGLAFRTSGGEHGLRDVQNLSDVIVERWSPASDRRLREVGAALVNAG
jgi:hypothetical protein